MSTKAIAIIGATSAIAQGIARLYAKEGARFMLVARNQYKVAVVASDLRSRGASDVSVFIADLKHVSQHDAIVAAASKELKTIDVVLIAHGVLKEQSELESDIESTVDLFDVNATSMISLAHRFGLALERQGSGTLVGLSSVAGERGRKSNYAYGAAKAALTAFLSGMRGRYLGSGVTVITVKPGPVDTPMTVGRTMPLMASVDRVSRDIKHGIERKKLVIYTPGIWRFIMFVLRAIPESIFQRLSI